MKISDYLKKNATAIVFSLIYVSIGGFIAHAYYPDDINSNWWLIGWIITFSVNIASCVLRAFGSVEDFPIIAIQTIMLVPTYLLTKMVTKKGNDRP